MILNILEWNFSCALVWASFSCTCSGHLGFHFTNLCPSFLKKLSWINLGIISYPHFFFPVLSLILLIMNWTSWTNPLIFLTLFLFFLSFFSFLIHLINFHLPFWREGGVLWMFIFYNVAFCFGCNVSCVFKDINDSFLEVPTPTPAYSNFSKLLLLLFTFFCFRLRFSSSVWSNVRGGIRS